MKIGNTKKIAHPKTPSYLTRVTSSFQVVRVTL